MLLIEDSASEARLIRELLAEASLPRVRLDHAVTLGEGLERLDTSAADVVLLDLSLPDSHGLDTLQTVRSAFHDLPVIVLTGSDEEDLALGAVEKGAQDYLVKGQVSGKSILRSARYAIARARTLKALRESQRLIHQVAELLYVIDPETFEIDHLSSAMERLIGDVSTLKRPGSRLRLSELIHPDDREAFEERMRGAVSLSEDDVVESEFRVLGAAGWCWLHARETLFIKGADGSPDLLLGTAQALANRPRHDEVLSSEINLLKNVFDALPQPIFVKDKDGRFLLSNAAHRRMLGVSEARQVLGKTDFELLPADLAQQNQRDDQAVLSRPALPGSKRPNEGTSAAEFKKTPLRDQSGIVIGLLAIGEKAG